MFTLTGSGIRNILFDARLHNPAQLTFCPAQFTSKKAHNFHFFPAPCQKASMNVHYCITPSIKKSFIVEQFQGNYLKCCTLFSVN